METTSGKFGALHCKASSVQVLLWSGTLAKGYHADETSVARSLLKGIRSLGDSGMLTYEEFISGGRSIDEDRKQQVKTLVKYGKGLCGEFSRLLQSFGSAWYTFAHAPNSLCQPARCEGHFEMVLARRGNKSDIGRPLLTGWSEAVSATFKDHAFLVLERSSFACDPTYGVFRLSHRVFEALHSRWEYCKCTGPNLWDIKTGGSTECDDDSKLTCYTLGLDNIDNANIIDAFTNIVETGPPVILRKFLPTPDQFYIYGPHASLFDLDNIYISFRVLYPSAIQMRIDIDSNFPNNKSSIIQ